MSIDEKTLERFGLKMAEDVGTGASEEQLRRQEQAFVSLVAARPPRSGRRYLPFALAGAAVAAAGVAAVLLLAGTDPLMFSVGQRAQVESRNLWVQAPPDQPLPIRFEDGTALDLSADAAMRIVESKTDRVDIELSRGRLAGDVRSGGHTRWHLHAGPFRVTVLGTVFSLDWHAERTTLDVTVSRGKVLVQGTRLRRHGIEVAAGDHLRVDGKRGIIALNPGQTAPASPPGRAEPEPPAPRPTAPAATETTSPRPDPSPQHTGRGAGPKAAWQRLYDQERYAEAISAARKAGVDELIGTAGRVELWQLGDAARNAGQVALAGRIFEAFRTRFGGSPKASIAAFLLGRMAYEQRGDSAGGIRWFETYLQEAPGGPLAEEALGRLMVVYDETGRTFLAKKSAEKYLALYPNGSFAKLAHHVAGR